MASRRMGGAGVGGKVCLSFVQTTDRAACLPYESYRCLVYLLVYFYFCSVFLSAALC